jgi:hypothetical protein
MNNLKRMFINPGTGGQFLSHKQALFRTMAILSTQKLL